MATLPPTRAAASCGGRSLAPGPGPCDVRTALTTNTVTVCSPLSSAISVRQPLPVAHVVLPLHVGPQVPGTDRLVEQLGSRVSARHRVGVDDLARLVGHPGQ